MRGKLERRYGLPQLHFITCSCAGRLPFLGDPQSRDTVLRVLHETRTALRFQIHGYVVMPEHIHLLLSEPEIGTPGTALQIFKQCVTREIHKSARRAAGAKPQDSEGITDAFWERRFYDFNVWSLKKRIEKLHYMHMNPVVRGLAPEPGAWSWSSFRFYQYGEVGLCPPDRFNPDECAPVGKKRNLAR